MLIAAALSSNEALCERAGSRIRTDDLLITNQLLYQLSYAGEVNVKALQAHNVKTESSESH